MKDRKLQLLIVVIFCLGLLLFLPGFNTLFQAQAAPDIYASPVHGGCYIAGPSDCRLHVEPFTINVKTGARLVQFKLYANREGGNSQVIYDFRTDISNPLPLSGNLVTLSLVAQDFAATCGETYSINLVGQDSEDPNPFNLGVTGQFTCPTSVP